MKLSINIAKLVSRWPRRPVNSDNVAIAILQLEKGVEQRTNKGQQWELAYIDICAIPTWPPSVLKTIGAVEYSCTLFGL